MIIAVSAPHSGDWLHALPLATCGLKLDNEAIIVAVGLLVGVSLCPTNALVAKWLTLAALTSYPANAAKPEQFAITSSTTSSAAHW